MIEKALKYLVGLKEVKVIEVGDSKYSTEPLNYIKPVFDPKPNAQAVSIKTLTGLVDYIKGNVDKIADAIVVHVVSPTRVLAYSELRKDMNRDNYISCEASTPQIMYEQFMDIERFNIMLQACFLQNEHSAAVLKVVGNIKEDNVQNTSDDGVSQKVTAKAGVSTVTEIVVPNPVILCPFRTFAEVDQPESKFVFRMRSGPAAAIFEADGGVWKIYAMQNVKRYLSEKLEGCNVKIIS
ncbi:MAG: hypothetical protein ABFD25_00740 [Clostridiaceae bacterium]